MKNKEKESDPLDPESCQHQIASMLISAASSINNRQYIKSYLAINISLSLSNAQSL